MAIILDRKMHLALHVDMLECHRRDVCQMIREKAPRRRFADYGLHRLSVPGHDNIGE